MKRLAGLLVAVIILTGCMGDKPVAQPGESQGESKPASSSASLQDIYAQVAMERMARIDMQDLASPDLLERLDILNINASVENIKPLSETELTFELCLSTASGGTVRLPIEASCSYDYLQEPLGGFKVEWGGISIANNKTLAVSTLKKLQFYNLDKLEPLPLTLDLTGFPSKDYYLLGAALDKALGIVVPVFYDNTDGFAYFNEDGTLNRIETIEGKTYERWFYSNEKPPRAGHSPVYYQDSFEILNLDVPYLVFGDISKVFYNTKEKRLFGQTSTDFDVTSNNRRAILLNFEIWFGDLPAISGKNSRLALYYENGMFITGFFLDGTDISWSFGRPEQENYPGLSYKWDAAKPIVSASCGFSDLTVTLDFERGYEKLEYKIKPEHIENTFATSADGRYSLLTSSLDGAGDIIRANVVLKDNETGALRFITTSGGMYGGYENIGFFQNGEIYVQTLERLSIISTDPAAPRPLLDFAMPLGYIKDKNVDRWLLTFRRDPVTRKFIILYAEHPTNSDLYKGELPYNAPFNYIVGLCDQDGNLLESYDTGQPVWADNFGIYKMGFHLGGDELTIIGEGRDEGYSMQGVFNLKTHTYKNTLPQITTQ